MSVRIYVWDPRRPVDRARRGAGVSGKVILRDVQPHPGRILSHMTKSELKCLVHVMRMSRLEVVVIQLLFAVAAFSPARSDIPEHLIKSLPGWEGSLPTTQYSGYIEVNATTGKYLHYWCVFFMCK